MMLIYSTGLTQRGRESPLLLSILLHRLLITTKIHTHVRAQQPMPLLTLTPSHLPPSPLLSDPSLPLSLSVLRPSSPLELRPLFLPALPPSTSTRLGSCENSLCVSVNSSSRVCVERSFVCVRGLCVFLSGAGVQPFISGVDCRRGEYSDLAALPFQLGTFYFPLFFLSLDGLRLCGLEAALPSLESFISPSSHSNLSQDFSTCLT